MSAIDRVALRGDGGPLIGSGHLMRLRAVAQALAGRDVGAELITTTGPPVPEGFAAVRTVRTPADVVHDLETELSEAAQRRDAAEMAASRGGRTPPAVLVDHYGLGRVWEESIRALGVARIGAIDDLPGRQHAVDVLVDPNLGTPDSGPRLTGPGRILRGPAYAPLAPEYRNPLTRPACGDRPRVVVSLGGGRSGLAPRLAAALLAEPRLTSATVDLVVPDDEERAAVIAALGGRTHTTVHARLPSLAPLLARADLVVGAGGSSSWERLRLGVPSVVVPLAPNQVRSCRELAALGLAEALDDATDVGAIIALAADTLTNGALLDRTRRVGPILVDGRGAERIALALIPPGNEPELRPARISDASALLAIANDPATRLASRVDADIRPDEHLRWLTDRLADPSSLVLIADVGDLPVGQVRFRRLSDQAWELSYALDAAARGNRWATGIIRRGIVALRELAREAVIVAVVREENVPSRRAFERVGFAHDQEGQRSIALGARVASGFTAYLLSTDATVR